MIWLLACTSEPVDTALDFVADGTGGPSVTEPDGPSSEPDEPDTADGDTMPPTLACDSSIDFGGVDIGVEENTTLVLYNEGDADLRLEAITLEGDAAFTLGSISGVLVPPAQNQGLQVTFAPTRSGTVTGEITIESNDPEQPEVQVQVSGTGGGDKLVIDPSKHDFGAVLLGCSVSQELVLSNPSEETADIDTLMWGAASSEIHVDVTGAGTKPWRLEPGESTSLVAIYAPTDTHADQAELHLLGDDTLSVQLFGEGTAYATYEETWVVDGATSTFELAAEAVSGALEVTLDGVQTKAFTHDTASNSVTLSSAPAVGVTVGIAYAIKGPC